MRFSPRLPNDTATLLLITSFIILLVGLADSAHDAASHHIKTISIISAVAILCVYGVWLWSIPHGSRQPSAASAEARLADRR